MKVMRRRTVWRSLGINSGLTRPMDVFDVTDPSSATQSSTSSSPDRLRDPLNDDLTPSWLLSAVAAANEKASAAGQPSGTYRNCRSS